MSEENKWQPIETAPKIHGKDVLLFDGGCFVGWWADGTEEWQADTSRGETDYAAPRSKVDQWAVTHWMPLPPAPFEKEAQP